MHGVFLCVALWRAVIIGENSVLIGGNQRQHLYTISCNKLPYILNHVSSVLPTRCWYEPCGQIVRCPPALHLHVMSQGEWCQRQEEEP